MTIQALKSVGGDGAEGGAEVAHKIVGLKEEMEKERQGRSALEGRVKQVNSCIRIFIRIRICIRICIICIRICILGRNGAGGPREAGTLLYTYTYTYTYMYMYMHMYYMYTYMHIREERRWRAA